MAKIVAVVSLLVNMHVGLALVQQRDRFQGFQVESMLKTQHAKASTNKEHDPYEWRLCDAKVHSNIAGTGPDTGPQELRFAAVAENEDGSGQEIDLVLTMADVKKNTYKGKAELNGKNGCFGMINMDKDSDVVVDFVFVVSGTNTPHTMKNFFFSVYDLDQSMKIGNKEVVTFNTPVASWFTTPGSELLQSGSNDGTLTFESTQFGTGYDNPEDPEVMNPLAKDRTVTVQYTDVSAFTLSFSIVKGKGGRNILFAGKSSFVHEGELPTCTEDGVCTVFEDPHITVFDGPQVSLLAYHDIKSDGQGEVRLSKYGMGDKWLVRSEDVIIQARYMEEDTGLEAGAMFVRAVAVGGAFMDGNTLIIGPLDEKVTWNGQEILAEETSKFHLSGIIKAVRHMNSSLIEDLNQPNAGIDIQLPQGIRLTINRLHRYVNAAIKMRPREDGQDGLCGNFNGVSTDDGLESVAQRLNPNVPPGESLFAGTSFELPLPAKEHEQI